MTTIQQSFNHFLIDAGPSTPRGRGRGGGGRGRGSGRGGRGGSSSGGSNLKKSDYSNVPFDYASINSRKYNKMDGYVQPFGPTDTPSSRGSPFPRGRGRGRGGLGATPTPASPRLDSGQSTPVRGLGHRGRGGGLGDRPSSGYKGKSTVGREGVTWGGRGAPLFVKGGELFKDGEVDIVRRDENDKITVETVPLSDPSAPQMTNMEDDVEIELVQQDRTSTSTDTPESSSYTEEEESINPGSVVETFPSQALEADRTDEASSEEVLEGSSATSEDVSIQVVAEEIEVDEEDIEEVFEPVPQQPTNDAEEEVDSLFFVDTAPEPALVEEESLFYVDTQPGQASSSTSKPIYNASNQQALGHREEVVSSDEEIVFAPKTYKQPQPIQIDMAQASGSRKPRPIATKSIVERSPPPSAKVSRAQKKAAKKEKKKGGGKKAKKLRRQPELRMDGSDIEWGSDGPPGGDMLAAAGVDESDGEDDVAVLRDYLEGTILNAKTGSADEMDDDQGMESDEVDEAIDLEMMKRFGAGVRQWNENGSAGSISGEDSDGSDPEEDEEDDDDSHVGEGEGESEDVSDSDSDEGIDVDGLEAEMEEDIDRQLALALAKGEEDSDIEELFTGKSGWGEEDWFLQSMADAVNPKASTYRNRKSNSKLFHAIENGNFDDDFDLPSEPAKKNKNKHVPAELQVQWEKDRQAKAEKKRQRELDRIMAALDPHPAARKTKNKGKGRDMSHAASIAHLIPASATEVAEMFDISSGDDADIPSLWKNKRQGLLPDISETWMTQVNSQVQDFLHDMGKQSFSLPPMDKEGRMKIHKLAECYGLSSKSKGGGRGRFTVLYKTSRSGQNVNHRKIDRLVKASHSTGGAFYKSFFGNGNPNKFHKSNKGNSTTAKGNGNMPSLRARDGDEVGGGAEKIGMDNVGHRLLSKMGWADGDRIGRSGGLEAPIVAIVKNTKSGLGA